MTDPLPDGLTYVSATGTDWTCSATGVDVSCTLAGTLAVGAAAPTITVAALVGAAAYPSVVNTATTYSTDPALPERATDSDDLVVDPDSGLTLTKHHQGTFTAGQQGTYLLTVADTGPTPTPGPVTITDPLPNGLTYVSAGGAGWTCSASGQQVTCTRPGELAVGATSAVTLTVLVGPAAVPSVVNTATATAPGSPPTSGSDTAPVTGPTTTSAVRPAGPSPGQLPFTGFDALGFVLAGTSLVGLGGLTLGATRRRRRRA